MRMHLWVLLLVLPMAMAPSVTVYIDLSEDVAHEQFAYVFERPFNQSFLQSFPVTADNLTLTPAVPFTYVNVSTGTTINITPLEPITELSVSISSSDLIFHNQDKHRFTSDMPFDRGFIRNVTITLKLPVGYGTGDGKHLPTTAEVTSDGARVVLAWPTAYPEEIEVISVEYSSALERDYSLIVILAGCTALLLLAVFGLIIYSRRKGHAQLLRGFREDERKAIEYIRTRTQVMQRDLQKELSFSRAKSTRVVKKLEKRGLITKESRGRTNKISWKG